MWFIKIREWQDISVLLSCRLITHPYAVEVNSFPLGYMKPWRHGKHPWSSPLTHTLRRYGSAAMLFTFNLSISISLNYTCTFSHSRHAQTQHSNTIGEQGCLSLWKFFDWLIKMDHMEGESHHWYFFQMHLLLDVRDCQRWPTSAKDYEALWLLLCNMFKPHKS